LKRKDVLDGLRPYIQTFSWGNHGGDFEGIYSMDSKSYRASDSRFGGSIMGRLSINLVVRHIDLEGDKFRQIRCEETSLLISIPDKALNPPRYKELRKAYFFLSTNHNAPI